MSLLDIQEGVAWVMDDQLLREQQPSNGSLSLIFGYRTPLQVIWDLRLGHEDVVSSPVFTVALFVSFYFMAVTPWMILDLFCSHWHWLKRYKLQTDKEVTWKQVRNAMTLTLWNHLLYILPASTAQWVWHQSAPLPTQAPSLPEFIWHHFAALAIFDVEYWIWHWTHHNVRILYRNIHSVHHHYSSPNAWVTQYLHPFELLTVGVFSNTAPLLVGAHPLTSICYQLWTIQISIEAHVGYDFPFMLHRWIPFYGGSIHHDMHHMRPKTNLGPYFTWLDHIFGTFCPGLAAGGVKSAELIEWEEKDKQRRVAKRQLKQQKAADYAWLGSQAFGSIPFSSMIGQYFSK